MKHLQHHAEEYDESNQTKKKKKGRLKKQFILLDALQRHEKLLGINVVYIYIYIYEN